MSGPVPSGRLASLDAFRGLTIAGMILVNDPGSWEHVYPPLLHAEWHGWTPTDLVFPFFLFVMGVGMAFSLARRLETGGRSRLHLQVLRRTAILFALGLFLSAFPDFDLSRLRVAGVLTRIAVVYLLASLVVIHLSRRAQAWTAPAILLGYWAAMALVPVPGAGAGAGDFSPEGNLAAWIDRALLPGRLYRGTWDPEGLFSTLPAVATALLGVFTGRWIRSEDRPGRDRPGRDRPGRDRTEIAAGMFAAGWLAILAGLAWDLVFPINKNLWTSSYVLFTAGAALEGLALCYWLIDCRGVRRWAWPAIVYGLNPIAVYVLSGLLMKLLDRIRFADGSETTSLASWIYRHLFLPWAPPVDASLAFAVSYVVFWWAMMALLYRRRIFIKI